MAKLGCSIPFDQSPGRPGFFIESGRITLRWSGRKSGSSLALSEDSVVPGGGASLVTTLGVFAWGFFTVFCGSWILAIWVSQELVGLVSCVDELLPADRFGHTGCGQLSVGFGQTSVGIWFLGWVSNSASTVAERNSTISTRISSRRFRVCFASLCVDCMVIVLLQPVISRLASTVHVGSVVPS